MADCKIEISVREADFDSAVETEKLRAAGIGAVASFIGIVRNEATGPGLIALTLEHYPEMTSAKLHKIAERAASRRLRQRRRAAYQRSSCCAFAATP